MKSLELTLVLLRELGESLDIDTTRDGLTVARRTAAEGEEFLTITLPRFGKAVERCLELGYWDSALFVGFRQRAGLPALMQGFLSLIRLATSGAVDWSDQDDARSVRAVSAVRQICHLHGKVNRPCAPRRVRKAQRNFVKTDQSLQYTLDPEVKNLWDLLFGEALGRVEEDLLRGDLYFRHGPGAVAEKLSSNQKWNLDNWTDDLQRVLPWWHVTRATAEIVAAYRSGEDPSPAIIPKPASRLVAVPKTALTPRLIAIEPSIHQFVQQMLFELIERHVSQSKIWSRINWRDQERNRKAALQASLDGSQATLDLSEASDRVSWGLVRDLMGRHAFLLKHISASRSEAIDVDGVLHTLSKFASMGSALTFPIETMVFITVALVGTYGSAAKAFARVREGTCEVQAYGDDILVPAGKMSQVISLLETHGFLVNSAKSFGSGSFRESCGADCYRGVSVTPVRVRSAIDDPATADWLESAVELHNRLFSAGLYSSAALVSSWAPAGTPWVPSDGKAVGLWTDDPTKPKYSRDKDLQVLVVRALRFVKRLPSDILDGYAALRKCLNPSTRQEPLSDGHLSEAGRPRTGRAKYVWTAVD